MKPDPDKIVCLLRDCGPMRNATLVAALGINDRSGTRMTTALRKLRDEGRVSLSGGKWNVGPPRESCKHCDGKGWTVKAGS